MADTKMTDSSSNGHAELAADAGNIDVFSGQEERAAKRLKVTDSAAEAIPSVPGEGLHDAPVAQQEPKVPTVSNEGNGEAAEESTKQASGHVDGRTKGVAPVKKEFLVDVSSLNMEPLNVADDDAAEAGGPPQSDRRDDRDRGGKRGRKDKKNSKGQNTERTFGQFDDAIRLCNSRAFHSEFSPRECHFGERCRLSHDLRKYMAEGRRADVESFEGMCPVFKEYGKCPSGWKCRFVKSHMQEIEHDDGRKELVLIDKTSKSTTVDKEGEKQETTVDEPEDQRPGICNIVPISTKLDLNRKRVEFAEADQYITWLNQETKANEKASHRRKDQPTPSAQENQAEYVEPPFLPSEKRRLYFGPETPTLAPLTTQGNLPFRRLCVELGAQLTYSEMALGLPLVQGNKSDWTLLKAHESELSPPKYTPGKYPVFDGYDNTRDIKFGAQISTNQHWIATKAANALSRFVPQLRLIDLNCGCPIDMVFKSGGGSALLESHGKLERMIRGMNATSGEIPITAKIRTGVKNNRPTATQVIGRLAFGSRDNRERLGAPGCAAITLHGRSREQRYTKQADWGYVGECASLIKTYNEQKHDLTDTAAEPDERTLPNAKDGRMYFLGNGDCYSHLDHQEHIDKANVDSVMIGRGALIKPWLFEEIEQGQYLDKSATERLGYVEKFVRYGLEAWGSDELGIGFTRRFLLEWLSFTHRYIPLGLLEVLPPQINDRPPMFKGRNELETLMASSNYKDWIKISEMFLGPVHPTFQFQPKHKSNAYEAEG